MSSGRGGRLMFQDLRKRVASTVSGLDEGGPFGAVALRVVPVLALMLATGWVVLAGTGTPETSGSIQAIGVDGVTQSPRAVDGPGRSSFVSDQAERPRLFVQDDQTPAFSARSIDAIGREAGSGDEADDDADAAGDAADDPAEETAGDAAGNADGGATTSTTDRDATTTTARRTTTTGEPTTSTSRRTTTTRATTTQPPTTAAPTTQPPTTAAPTTQPPTTQPSTTSGGGNCASNGEFELVFRDDFNGSSVSGSWSQYNSAGNAGYGLRRPSAISVSNGSLWITAQMENGQLVSGGMAHRFDQKYGKFVIKVRTDNDPSQAVSGVVLTWPQSGVHPRDGENNIYETLVQTPYRNPFFTFIHKPYGSHSDQEYKEHHADGSQFQTMTMEWTPSRITIIREGPGGSSWQDVWTVNETGADLIPDVPHHLAIQLDGWKHSIGGTVRMQVDFVEVHKYCG